MSNNTIQLLKSFLEQDPNDSFTHFALAMEYKKVGNIQQSKSIFEKLVVEDPDYVGTYYHLGKLLEQIGNTEAAKNVFTDGIKIAEKVGDQLATSELKQALLELDF